MMYLVGRDTGSVLVPALDSARPAVPGPKQEVPWPRGRLLRPRLLLPPVLLLHGMAQGKDAVQSLMGGSHLCALFISVLAMLET